MAPLYASIRQLSTKKCIEIVLSNLKAFKPTFYGSKMYQV